MNFGVSSMTAPLKAVAVRAPGPALLKADRDAWHYGPQFDPARIEEEHAQFVALLEKSDVQVLKMVGDDAGIADAVFAYDASLVTPAGAVLMSPGKYMRRGEEQLHDAFYQSQSIPVIGQIEGDARAEAGDTLWLDDQTLAVGRGFRTNQLGIEQLANIVSEQGISVLPFDMPVFGGEEACLHLMSLISMVAEKTALICKELIPVALYQKLGEMDFKCIEAPYEEFISTGTLSLNVLALAPSQCVMVEGAPKTTKILQDAGIDLQLFSADALCIACEGGPTCLTRPILRS